MTKLNQLQADVRTLTAEVERARLVSKRADRGKAKRSNPPAGWTEFVAYLRAAGRLNSARFALECERRLVERRKGVGE